MFLFMFTIFVSISGCQSQSVDTIVNITQVSYTTSCNNSLYNDVDMIYLIGTINTTGVNLMNRRIVMFEGKTASTTYYNALCTVDISRTCGINTRDTCYCRTISTSLTEVVLNITASSNWSIRYVRVSWPAFTALQLSDISLDRQLPVIYDKAVEKLVVNKNEVKELDNCTVSEQSIEIIWCANNLLNPTLTISYNGVLASTSLTSDCVNYTSPLNTPLQIFTVSYQESVGCSRRNSHTCTFNDSSSIGSTINVFTTIPTTLNTTASTTRMTSVTLATTTERPYYYGVGAIHGTCTMLEAMTTIIVIVFLNLT